MTFKNWTWVCECGGKGKFPITHTRALHNGRTHMKKIHNVDSTPKIIRWMDDEVRTV